MVYETLHIAIDDRVATITFNRPERLNAFNEKFTEELPDAVRLLDADESVRIIIVTGAGGKAFSSGYDLKDSADRTEQSLRELNDKYALNHEFAMSLWHCSKPVIAMIDGYCLAGALELALCCDIRYCSDTSQIGVLESRFGGGIGTMMIPWILGNRCRELVYSGDILDAREALRLGLVDRVFPQPELAGETMRIAKRMSRVAATCQRWNKRAINQAFETMGLHTALRYGMDAASIMRGTGSPERKEFDRIRSQEGLSEALKWRKSLFAPFE
ncbi:enoyl-CoA hydratase/isomerase family protein [Aquamicrobium ahrensii]|uniref:Enoyl-CoA hydratase n=1 Tax=Aquamicrobium ahrensii TaxID=469551 RepID=A0ABV2KT25_9HYPH